MESKINEWIHIARKVSKYLLSRVDSSSHQEVEEWGENHRDILKPLNTPEYYARKSNRKKEIDKKYTYERFVASHKYHRRIQIVRYAAVILLLLSAGTIAWFYHGQPEQEMATNILHITPGNAKASLVLGNGEEISLDARLTLTEKDGTVIQNDLNGELAYHTGMSGDTVVPLNTLRVPQGGEYRLVLADGTKVWINSESELSFPTQFSNDKREVFLKGEAYFEIAPNQQIPFYVNSNNIRVRATGTAFNVMAYNNEPDLRVTLTEGGVDIESLQQIVSRLTPNHQFTMNKENGKYHVSNVDSRTATAWKDGNFFFDNEPLSSIIRKLTRWYGIDIVCHQSEINQYKFSGQIRKYEDAIKVLDMLRLTNEIAYTIRPDRKVIIEAIK